MDLPRPSSTSPSGFRSRCLDIRSDSQYTEDIMLENHDRMRHVLAQTGYAQPSNGGLSPHYASFVSARYDSLQGSGRGTSLGTEQHPADFLYPPSQDGFSPSLDDILVAYPSSPSNDYVRSNAPSPSVGGPEKHAYMSPVKHSRYDGDSFFQFLDSESAALQYLTSSSPPPQSSSPLPQSSPPSDDPLTSSCLASNVLDPVQEEDSFTDAPPFIISTPDLSPLSNASYHSRFSTFDKHSSKSSLTSSSSRSQSSSRSRSDSPDGAHTNTGDDLDNAHERNDEFTNRLHELLLMVARERERVVECEEDCYCQSTPSACDDSASDYTGISPPCDSRGYEVSPRTSRILFKTMDDKYRIYARSPSPRTKDDYDPKLVNFTASPTLYSPSAIVSPRYWYDHATSETEIDTLVFASPSCSPPPRTLKRPRSLSVNHADIYGDLSFKRKLQKTRSSIFSSSTDSNNAPTPKPTTKEQAPIAQYRIIKTPSSFLAQRKLQQDHQDEADLDLDERPTKIQRIKSNYDASSVPRNRRNFATGPASLRRAVSLRSDAESEADDNEENTTPTVQAGISLVPTVPSTPQASTHAHRRAQHHQRRAPGRRALDPQISPVPIIAPPVDHMPRFPLSVEANAKVRLERLLEREKKAREADGLEDGGVNTSVRHSVKGEEDCSSVDCGDRDTNDDDDEPHSADDYWEAVLGIGESLRRDVIQWILEVIPIYVPISRGSSCPSRSSSCSSSCSSSSFRSESSTSTSSSKSLLSSVSTSPDCNTKFNLLDQLSTSPETRFHAAYMFLRYFYLISGGSSYSASGADDDHAQPSKVVSGQELATWDIGVACLALSVKFHRDFLNPLLPVYAYEFQALAPHDLAYEDLETSQRDILASFSYRLGSTPQAVLDELWVALPSLRQLFDYDGGWNCVTKETWWRLFEAVLEPDVLQFGISLLTAAALTDAIQGSLVRKYEYEAKWNAEMARRRRPKNGSGLKCVVDTESKVRTKRERRAEREAEGVVQDIQVVLRIPDARLRECRSWLSGVLD